MLRHSSIRSERNTTSTRHENHTQTIEQKTLALQRLHTFLADDALRPAYTYGGTTTEQARDLMMEKLYDIMKNIDDKDSSGQVNVKGDDNKK